MTADQIDYTTAEGRQLLRREIAERLGWKVTFFDSKWNGPTVELYSPDGQRVGSSQLGEQGSYSQAELWEEAILMDGDDSIPDWPNDLNAAAALPLEGGDRLWVMADNKHIIVQILRYDEATGYNTTLAHQKHEWTAYDAQIEARLRSVAWVEYQKTPKTVRS